MPKPTLVHICSNCDAQFPKWSGRCESCGAWGTVSKEAQTIGTTDKIDNTATHSPAGTKPLAGFAAAANVKAVLTSNEAFDQITGGLVAGSVTLITGEPGMGKSSLLSQVAISMSRTGKTVIYAAGEESPTQVAIRLKRMADKIPDTLLATDDMTASALAACLMPNAKSQMPNIDLMIVDSIQSVRSEEATGEAGSVGQVKACAAILTAAAKKTNVPVILVGQVTKDGDIAGPRVLEHVVDTVLSIEGDRTHRFRLLRVIKNRFGTTDEAVVMDMTERGLEIVADPSLEMISGRGAGVPGSAITCVLEGRRPLLVEIQALVTPAGYSAPTRKATGLDSGRLNMLLAVLTRHAGIAVYDKDVYANAAGGLYVRDPAADLALAAAIASVVNKKPLDGKTAYFGEIGLTGELRAVALPELRLKELKRMGFNKIVCPAGSKMQKIDGVEVVGCKTVREAIG